MPTYEYECRACDNAFEKEQRITESALKKCPKCGKNKLVRLVGTGNFILKGGGWYSDLYSSTPASSKSSPPSESSTKAASTDKTSDTKSEKPTKPKKKTG